MALPILSVWNDPPESQSRRDGATGKGGGVMLHPRQHFSGVGKGQRSGGVLVDVPAFRAVDLPAFVRHGCFPVEKPDFDLVLPVAQGVASARRAGPCEGFRDVGRFLGGCHV